MKKNIAYILIMSTMLLSCGNKKVNVNEAFEDDQTRWGRIAEKQQEQREKEITLAELGGDVEESKGSNKGEPVNIAYKEWKLGYAKDDYGDEVKDIKFILLDLDAYYPKDGETGKGISISYCYNKITGIELLMFSSSQGLGKYEEISFKTKDGYQIEFIGEYRGREGQQYSGSVVFYDKDDMKSIADILSEGNFKLKVGYYVADVKDETRGFRESVEKNFKGEDIEILLPRITRE